MMNLGRNHIVLSIVLGLTASVSLTGGETSAQSVASPLLPNRVIAVYFHRTQRCPTCLRVSQTVAGILQKDFAQYLQTGQLQYAEVDFESPRNAELAKSYHITGPQLVLIRVENARVAEWQPMPKVWSLLIKPQELEQYVTSGVTTYLGRIGISHQSGTPIQ
ncbi:MAG: nitrophenyl compound nitroreductase subunit ArsF family protein [Thermogutta sp.]